MSTWQILSDAGDNYRWEISDQHLHKAEQWDADAVPQQHIGTNRLPSMADLLLLGCAKLLENGESNLENTPMFRTGLGKTVSLKDSSIAKARSVLGDVDGGLSDTGGQWNGRENGYTSDKQLFERNPLKPAIKLKPGLNSASKDVVNVSNSMFQTGSGKTVNISPAGLLRAKTLLGLDDNNDQESLCGFELSNKQSTSSEHLAWENPTHLMTSNRSKISCGSSAKVLTTSSNKSDRYASASKEFPGFLNTALEPPSVKFQTAGGRSISVSNDALERARSLLGNPEFDSFLNEATSADSVSSVIDNGKPSCSLDQINDHITPVSHKGTENGDSSSRNFTSPLRSSSYQKQSSGKYEKLRPGNNLIKKFDAEAAISTSNGHHNVLTSGRKPPNSNSYSEKVDCVKNVVHPKFCPSKGSSNGVLVDISNTMSTDGTSNRKYLGEKRKLGRIRPISTFKKPRSSFVTPLNQNNSSTISVLSRLAPQEPCCRQRVSIRYPPQVPRAYLKEFVLQLPSRSEKLENLPDYVNGMNPIAAEIYTFQNEKSSDCIGPDAFYGMLAQSGASIKYLTKEWVTNHYKWIVWKLGCYERCFPAKFSTKLLTVSNVLEELRYRYEREVNHGHRSAIKKILDGDATASSMMVLCISSVGQKQDLESERQFVTLKEGGKDRASNIELTDGCVKALLDEQLSKKLASGKLFLGQKLRIWGAKLNGWLGPVSPLQASETTTLILHINGTYRCHWAERLGFCKSAGFPLAFRCIKGNGGAVPSTLIGVTRVYPVLYRERLKNGSFIVRSERAEAKAVQLYNQRREVITEGIISSFQRETEFDVGYDDDTDEGAKLMKFLETAAEPEILMAGMTSKQLTSVASYKAKLETMRKSEMQKSIEKSIEAAGLSERDVTPFLRVKVVGLTNKCHVKESCPQKGLITIWSPTQKQKLELCEGQAYNVGGLCPSTSDSGILYLQARGSTSNWLPLSHSTMKIFETFFRPRSSTTISSLGEVPLSSEFDIAALVVYVGEVYRQGHQQSQWVFVTDGSMVQNCSKESPDALLAVNFCLPFTQNDSSPLVNSNIAGSVVGFCNLMIRQRDEVNNLWVAEATQNSDYFLSYEHSNHRHLKDAAASVSKWTYTSNSIIEKLKERILSIIRSSEDGS